MRCRIIVLLLLTIPQSAWAKHHRAVTVEPPVDYGIGLVCPIASNATLGVYGGDSANQISSDAILFSRGTGYTLRSNRFENLEEAGIKVFEGYCENHWPALRIDARTDRWIQLGTLWAPTGQDWNYLGWDDILQKSPVLHGINTVTIYDGSEDEPLPPGGFNDDAPHGSLSRKSDLRPLRFQDNYVMVEVGRAGVFGDGCTALPPAQGVSTAVTGWIRYTDDDGKPLLIPRKRNGC